MDVYDCFERASMKTFLLALFLMASVQPGIQASASLCNQKGRTAAHPSQEVAELLAKLRPVVQGESITLATEQTRKDVFNKILSISRASDRSRRRSIATLANTFNDDRTSADTRIFIARLLSELKAVETLELLVGHLDLRGTYASLSLTIRPMVDVVVRFGPIALPYLENALSSDNISLRQEACVALGLIGGEQAKRVLQGAAKKESNEDVMEYIKGGLSEIAIRERQKRGR